MRSLRIREGRIVHNPLSGKAVQAPFYRRSIPIDFTPWLSAYEPAFSLSEAALQVFTRRSEHRLKAM
jgi:hypothetical protein